MLTVLLYALHLYHRAWQTKGMLFWFLFTRHYNLDDKRAWSWFWLCHNSNDTGIYLILFIFESTQVTIYVVGNPQRSSQTSFST